MRYVLDHVFRKHVFERVIRKRKLFSRIHMHDIWDQVDVAVQPAIQSAPAAADVQLRFLGQLKVLIAKALVGSKNCSPKLVCANNEGMRTSISKSEQQEQTLPKMHRCSGTLPEHEICF
jgi:hypothetical protein